MKKLIYAFLTMIFLLVTISMITKNHTSTVLQQQNTSGISVRNDMVLEERP